MGQGISPEQACLKALEKIVQTTKLQPHLINEDGLPNFGLNFYALNKKGEFGSACMWSGGRYAAHDGAENRLRDCAIIIRGKNTSVISLS